MRASFFKKRGVGTAEMATLLLGLLHWNPHWECFVTNPDCTAAATAALDQLLSTPGTDFANIVEFEVSNYSPPAPWKAIGAYQSCGHDWATLFYNTNLWDVVTTDVGCVYDSRSYAAASFKSKAEPDFSVVIVGAHYPQTLNASTHAYVDANDKLKSVFAKLAVAGGHAIFLADTNTESPEAAALKPDHHGVNRTQLQLATDLGIWSGTTEPPAAPLYYGCCYSDGFDWQGDRVIANFGTVVESHILFDPAPSWANMSATPSEFHKGMRAILQFVKG